MSGWSESIDCPYCGSEESLEFSAENRPVPTSEGICLECGFSFKTDEKQLTLDEVNEERANLDMEPLEKLKESTFREYTP